MAMSNLVSVSVGYPMPLQIILKNTQNVDSPSPFQQMLQLEVSEINSVLPKSTPRVASDFHNVRFKYNYSYIPAWLESISNGIATIWVKLPVSIPANSSITIDMEVDPSLNFDGVYWGEAPELSPIYGQYDNGVNVFDLYFNGNTPTSDFITGGGDTVTQQTGVTLPNGAIGNVLRFVHGSSETATTMDMFTAKSLQNFPNYYINETSFQSDGSGVGAVWGFVQNSGNANSENAILVGTQFADDYFYQEVLLNGGGGVYNSQGNMVTTWRYSSLIYNSSSSYYAYIAPQLYSTSGGYSGTVYINSVADISPLYWGWYGAQGINGAWVQFNWVRVRAYPPNGVMPSVEVIV